MPFKYNPFTHKMDIVESASDIGAITTITGNVNGPQSPIAGNFNFLTANTTIKFSGSAATETLDFGLDNLGLGSSYPSLSSGTRNSGYGRSALHGVTTGQDNSSLGWFSMLASSLGSQNTAIGSAA